jgi:sugar phosphate isomerase/epimerase
MTNTSLNERINTEKALRKKALEKANEIASIINGVGGDRMKYMTGMINSEENADGLPSTKDLKNLRDEKKAAASIDKGNKALEDFQEAGTQNEVLGDFVDEVQQEVDQLDQEIEVGLIKQLLSSLEICFSCTGLLTGMSIGNQTRNL